jgi:lipopolysaccharide/colanic/teichoic acid biosynthesis glycosyltransferase
MNGVLRFVGYYGMSMDWEGALRRGLDVTLATTGLLATLPMWPVLSFAIIVEDGLPVLYRATRIGQNGRPFTLLKFRSMRTQPIGPRITRAGDARVTRVGRFIRPTKLDEIPQLLNVLLGDMSIVGPRPEDPRYLAFYTLDQRRLLRIRPGLTSPATIRYRGEEALLPASPERAEAVYVAEILPAKLKIDLSYFASRSIRDDIVIILGTLRAILRPARSAPI